MLHTCYTHVALFKGKFEGRIAHVTYVTLLFKEFITITLQKDCSMCNMCISSKDFYEYTCNIYVTCSSMSVL